MTLSFKSYIEQRPSTTAATDAFVAWARSDATLAGAQSWAELESYLLARATDRAAIKAAKSVWRAYSKVANRAED
jgi:hypothetical protein